MQSFAVKDFSGGMDDNYLSSPANTAYLYSNLWIDVNGKLHGRDGVSCFGTRGTVESGSTIFYGLYLGEQPYGRPIAFRASKAYFIDDSNVWTEILGPTFNPAVPNKPTNTSESLQIWQRQLNFAGGDAVLPGRIYCTDFSNSPSGSSVNGFSADFSALTLGVPGLASDPSLASAGGSGNNYVYAFHYEYTFTDFQGTTFEEKGIVREVSISNVGAPDSDTISITDIPVLANTGSTNYDTDNIIIFIYRTQDNGNTFNKVGQVTNGVTTFDDSMSDEDAINELELYSDGGVLEYDQPPVGARYLTQVNDFFWYATDQFVTHSIQGSPGAAPQLYYQFLEQKITGLSAIIGFPILFCDRSVFRIEGNYDELGGNGFDLREISKTAGCKSNRSIVSIPGGLVWAGNGGFYFTDGYTVQRITKQLATRYKVWDSENIVGTYDPDKNMVLWTVTSTISSTYCDLIAVLHLNFGTSERMQVTTWESAKFSCTTLAYSDSQDVDDRFKSKLLAMDYRGYMLSFDELYYTDPSISVLAQPEDFSLSAIIWRYESPGMDFGDDSIRKYCNEITAELGTDTNTAMRFLTKRDDGGPWQQLSEVRTDLPSGPGVILWNIAEYAWDDPNDVYLHDWNSQPITEAKRHLPNGILRSNRRHIAFTNSLTQIAKSDDLGTVNVNGTTKTFTLTNLAKSFPGDCEEYEISFSADNYIAQWVIKTRVSDTQLILWDPYGTLTTQSNVKWQMKGYRKFDRPFLLSYTIWFDEQGELTQAPQRGNSANGLING